MAKIKLKTNRGAAKRFKVTGKGALKRAGATKRHMLTKKNQVAKRNLRGLRPVHPSDVAGVKQLLCLE